MTNLTATLAERGARYGKFEDHAVIAQGLKDQMWATEGWSRLAPDQRQALEVIQDKVARILNGDPDYIDNWHDIAGYARLVEERLTAAADATRFHEHCADVRSEAIKSGWIEWKGGDCPVPPGTHVDVKHRDGEVFAAVIAGTGAASEWGADDVGTIIAYRLSPEQA